MEVRRQTVVQAAGEGKLWREAVPGRKHPRLELAGVALHLVAVLVDASEEVGAAVDIEHDAAARVAAPLALVVVGPHLYPLGLERAAGLPPLPPLAAADLADAIGPQLRLEDGGGVRDLVLGDLLLLDLDPLRVRNPLRGEGL